MNDANESHEESHFRKQIFYVVLDNVVGGPTVRFSSYKKMSREELKCKAAKLAGKYSKYNSSKDLVQKMNHITMVHNANFVRK